MSGEMTECVVCDGAPCRCKVIKVSRTLKNFDKSTDKLYQVLVKPKGFRQRLLKWLFPELRDVADDLRKCYWDEGIAP